MKFRKKPVVIEAITFDELIQYGKENGANIAHEIAQRKKRRLRSPGVFRGPHA